jgi:predicted outer membrane repeat protein
MRCGLQPDLVENHFMALSFWQAITRHTFLRRLGSRRGRPAARARLRLRLTALEDRTLLSTLVVTNLLDSGDGSLRDQIAASAAGDSIVFDSSLRGTITLTSGELDIPHDLTIQGPGAATLTVSGGNTQRVFHIEPDAAATIADLTIANGRVRDVGGGIDCEGSLTLRNSVVTGNIAQMGAGVYFVAHNTARAGLAVSGSTFTNNSAVNGAGLFSSVTVRSGSVGVTVTNSTFTNNIGGGNGGAVDSVESVSATGSATFRVSGGTFSGNQASTGGAIALMVSTADAGQATATVSGATIQHNKAGDGGGIASRVTSADTSQGAAMVLGNVIESNTADNNGGGLFSALTSSDDGQATFTFAGSTSARMDANTATLGAGIYDTETTTGTGSAAAAFNSGNIFGNIAGDSGGGLYGLLMNSGAGTASLTLTGGSITANQAVINRAGGVYAVGTASGTGAVNVTITGVTVSANMARTDAGGVYASVLNTGSGPVSAPASVIVDSSIITNNTGHNGGGLVVGVSTNQGTGAASATLSHDTISGNRAAAGGGAGGIQAAVGATGFGPASLAISSTTVSGNVADATGGGLAADLGLNGPGAASLSVTGSTFSGNTASSEGGGIRVRAGTNFFARVPSTVNVTLTDSTVSGNRSLAGAGLYLELDAEDSVGGRVRTSVTSSTISGNTATGQGGGIYAQEQGTATTTVTLALVNSTLYGNRAGTGGGLYNHTLTPGNVVDVQLTSVTVAFNEATSVGGGLAEAGGHVTVLSTIVAGNAAADGADASGSFLSAASNLVGQTDGSDGWLAADLTGTADEPLDAGFGDFGNFGGPTKTLSLLEDSPAVGQGSFVSPATDQRGVSRNPAAPSIGAFDFVKPSSFLVVPSVETIPAGVRFSVTVTARDGTGVFLTGYTGTIHFSSSDPDAILPADYTFKPTDQGRHTFTMSVSLQTEGSQTLDVTGTGAAGTATVTVMEPGVSRRLPDLAALSAQGGPGLGVSRGTADMFLRELSEALEGDNTVLVPGRRRESSVT